MTGNRIFNNNRLSKYYWQTANIVDDLGLSVYAFRLYGHLVRVSSQTDVDIATRALAQACKMSTGKVSQAKNELKDAGLISLMPKSGERGRPYHEITILDIAAQNIDHCQRSRNELKQSSSGELISSPPELISSRGDTPYKNIQELQVGASAPPASKKPEQPMTPTPKRDPVLDAFERHLQAQAKPNEATIRAWSLPPHLETLCLWFAEDMAVPVVKGDKGKYAKGASQLYEFHISREQHREICRRARAQKTKDGQRLTYGWPGALVELARQVVGEAAQAKGRLKPVEVGGVTIMAEEC